MSSRVGVKTYGRSQSNKVCQSSIQFDQLFNDKNKNKPSAAKSTGTLHRWGMTSFTSLRNAHVNGSSGDGNVDGENDEENEGGRKTVKRIKIAVDDDPFSFDAEPNSAKATYKVTQCSVNSGGLSSGKSSSAAAPAAKMNKFFKSGGSRSLFKLKNLTESERNRQKIPQSKPLNILVPVVNTEPVQFQKSGSDDAFTALLSSTSVSNRVTKCPQSTFEPFSTEPVTGTLLTTEGAHVPIVSHEGRDFCNSEQFNISYNLSANSENIASFVPSKEHINLAATGEPVINVYQSPFPEITLHGLTPPANSQMLNVAVTSADVVSYFTSSGIETIPTQPLIPPNPCVSASLDEAVAEALSGFCPSDVAVEPEAASVVPQFADTVPVTEDAHASDKVPPITIRLSDTNIMSDAVISKVDFTDSGEDSVDSLAQSALRVESVVQQETDEDSKLTVDAAVDLTDNIYASGGESLSQDLPPKPERLVRSASATFSVLRTRRIFNSPKKIDKRALYRHRPWQAEEDRVKPDDSEATEQTMATTATTTSSAAVADEFDEFDDQASEQPALTRVVTWPTREGDEAITSVRCPKKLRKFYTVVKNVKQAHQCHESGETQEFNDDIEYLLEGIQDVNPVGTRCLSILSLASKCMAPAFRMHLRAHGTLSKVFCALHDAPKESNLSLCTAAVMFIMSQDRLNMDLERRSLQLMLHLLDTETRSSELLTSTTNGHNREFDKNKQRIRELCEQLQKKGHAKHLDLDNITAGVLAMETLLSLTSRRAGEWVKEELRELGGLDHLVNTVSECGKSLPDGLFHLTEYALDKLRKLDRCLRVLESVAIQNAHNQSYLISCQNSALIFCCARALKLCERSLLCYPTPDCSERESTSWILFTCLLSILKVLLNLTNDSAGASVKVGEQDGLIVSTLSCVLHVPPHLLPEQRFELFVLSLGLLINLVEHCESNRHRLFFTEVTPPASPSKQHAHRRNDLYAPKALVNLFMEHEEAARLEEAKTDSILDGKGDGESSASNTNKEDTAATSQGVQDDLEETLTKALQKAGKNMEDSMVAAYIALLLGCLIQDNRDNANKIKDYLPNKDFDIMIKMLKKFLNFMHLTNVVGSTGIKSIQRVIDILEAT